MNRPTTPSDKDDQFSVTFDDLLRLCRRGKKRIIYSAVAVAILGLLYSLTSPVEYKAEASFREKGPKQPNLGGSTLAEMFAVGINPQESEAFTTINSKKLAASVIKKLGLQAVIRDRSDSDGYFSRIWNHLKADYKSFLFPLYPSLSDASCCLSASAVAYEGEIPLHLTVEALGKEQFQLFGEAGETLGQGRFGEPFIAQEFSFTLHKDGKKPLLTKSYQISLWPLKFKTDELMKKLKVTTEKTDKGLIKICYRDSSRHRACSVANTIMDSYRAYLQALHDQQSLLQLDYLQQRQDAMGGHLSQLMQKHAETLAKDLSNVGFADSAKEMEFLAANQHRIKERMLTNELEVKRLQSALTGKCVYYDHYGTVGDSSIINEGLEKIRQLQQQRDSLQIALQQSEKIIQERPIQQQNPSLEFQGVTLDTANELYIMYSKKLNDIQAEIKQNMFLNSQIENPDFEISSLSSSLRDAVSLEMISKASQLLLNLKDANNRSAKEQERLKEELIVQRSFLSLHLQQILSLQKLNERLIEEKIYLLQKGILELIQQRISLLENNLNGYIASRLENIKQERQILQQHLEEIQTEMAGLPARWMGEKIIDQNVETNQLIVQEIAKMMEFKNINHKLELIQSAPLDLATPALHPIHSYAPLYTLLGAFLGAISAIGSLLASSVTTGVRASHSNLQLLHQHVAGAFSSDYHPSSGVPLRDQDLDTLRRIHGFFACHAQGSPILLIEGEGPDYSADLAALVAKEGLKAVIISATFNQTASTTKKGLLNYLMGEDGFPEIIPGEKYDRIESGGVCRYLAELLGSKRFHELLAALKAQYDWVIVASCELPVSAAAERLSGLFTNIAVTVADESLVQLRFYIETMKEKKVTFVITAQDDG